jgi:hypothetical protein
MGAAHRTGVPLFCGQLWVEHDEYAGEFRRCVRVEEKLRAEPGPMTPSNPSGDQMRGEPADGSADGIVTRGPSCRPLPSLDQNVVTGPAVEVVRPHPADQDKEAERLAGDTDGIIAVGAVDDDGVGLEVCRIRAEFGFSPRITG